MGYKYINDRLCCVLDHSDNNIDVELHGCKGEVMLHQSKICRALLDFENADAISSKMPSGETISLKTNRVTVILKMGSGKTKLAISLILANKLPKLKPIYFCNDSGALQTRVFNKDRCINPTFIVVRRSVFGQWVDQIQEFSNLRIYKASDSRSIVKLAKLINTDLDMLNESYDIILINHKTISGNVDYVLKHCDNVFMQNKNKSKRVHMLLFNMLNRFYIRRLIYDDWDMLNIGISPLENAGSCIYMSATNNTSIINHRVGYINGNDTLKASMENPAYIFTSISLQHTPKIYVDDKFLDESIEIGLKKSTTSMMPPKPIVYIYNIENAENQAINIISELSTDEKIIESVNNLSRTSLSSIIRSLLADRFDSYKQAVKIIDTYIDIDKLNELEAPPEGSSFTQLDIERCVPIVYAYRNIRNRVLDTLNTARILVKNENTMLERVRSRISDNCCPICLESIKTEPSAIMLCCNTIIHVSCVVKCVSNTCPVCRTKYGRTFLDTFVCLHHDTDTVALLNATSSTSIANMDDEKNETEHVTKFTILRKIVQYDFSNINKTSIELNKFKSVIFDEKSKIETVKDKNKMKILIYCSSNETLCAVEKKLTGIINYSRLTGSSTGTYKKICRFRESTSAIAILANSWGDAAGIDFKDATDVIILNYINSKCVLQQMIGRVLRLGQLHRPRIHLISYQNESQKWIDNYSKSDPSSN